jgi:hypothetical protein
VVCSLPVNTCVVSDVEKCVVILWGIVGVYSHVCTVSWLGVDVFSVVNLLCGGACGYAVSRGGCLIPFQSILYRERTLYRMYITIIYHT